MKNNIIIYFLLLLTSCNQNIIDTKQDKFLTKELNKTLKSFGEFDIGLWNHIILDTKEDVCTELKSKFKDTFTNIMCRPKLKDNKDVVLSYLSSTYAIYPPPLDWKSKLKSNLSMLGMPLGADSQFFIELLRLDPFGFRNQLMSKINDIGLDQFKWVAGYLTDLDSKRRIIPVKFSYKAKNIEKTTELVEYLKTKKSYLIGRHFDFYINQVQIHKDIKSISIVSFFLLLFAIYFLKRFRKFYLLQLLIPSIVATIISAIFTVLLFGSIHGITISLGFAIIGLGMDYGIHLSFAKIKSLVLRSNIFGLITTLCVFICFSFSSIPLIKEMMFFSGLGVMISFAASYFLFKNKILVFDINLKISLSKKHLLSGIVVLVGIFAFLKLNYQFGMRRFNYVPEQNKLVQEWFYSKMGAKKLFFKTYSKNNIESLSQDYLAMKKNKFDGQNIFNYLPNLNVIKENNNKWQNFFDMNMDDSMSKKLYSPFKNNWDNYYKNENKLFYILNKSFLKHLSSDKNILSLWFIDRSRLSEFNLEGTYSLEDSLIKASNTLSKELRYFIMITFIIILMTLLIRYRNIYLSFACMIPFVFSIGLYGFINYFLASPVSFMSLMGLLLLYGMSVDYGIFSTDHYLNKTDRNIELNSGLILSWISSFIGFFPLIFCNHNILFDLGLVVVVGLFGIFYSTFFVLPAFLKWIKYA